MSDIQWKYAKNPHDGGIVSIEEANKLSVSSRYKPSYKCLDCGRPMDPKKGEKKRHHFAHRTDEERNSCRGEGARHWTAKINLEKYIRAKRKFGHLRVSDVTVEHQTATNLRVDLRILFDLKAKEDNFLYVEVVDKNPPDDRKIRELNEKMLVFKIQRYEDEYIENNHFLPDFDSQLSSFLNKKNHGKRKCVALANSGHRCKNYPTKGGQLCQYHRPRKKGYVRRRAYIFRIDSPCYSCKNNTPLIHAFSPPSNKLYQEFDENWFGNYEITMDDDFQLGSKISEIYPWVRLEFSRTQNRKVHANHCIHCDRMQGNFFTRKEMILRLGNGDIMKPIKSIDYFSKYELDMEIL